jgi:hypothetical protein
MLESLGHVDEGPVVEAFRWDFVEGGEGMVLCCRVREDCADACELGLVVVQDGLHHLGDAVGEDCDDCGCASPSAGVRALGVVDQCSVQFAKGLDCVEHDFVMRMGSEGSGQGAAVIGESVGGVDKSVRLMCCYEVVRGGFGGLRAGG